MCNLILNIKFISKLKSCIKYLRTIHNLILINKINMKYIYIFKIYALLNNMSKICIKFILNIIKLMRSLIIIVKFKLNIYYNYSSFHVMYKINT